MEAILHKKRRELIKEGLGYIDYWEEYTKNNNPNVYNEYLVKKEEKILVIIVFGVDIIKC